METLTRRAPFRRTTIGAKVRDASDLFVRLVQKRLRPYDLTINQFRLLREVWEDEGVTQREISARMRVSEPATVATIDALESRGMVRRVRAADDKRKSLIFLTPEGERTRDRIIEVNAALNAAATHGLSPEEIRALGDLLDRITHNLLVLTRGDAGAR